MKNSADKINFSLVVKVKEDHAAYTRIKDMTNQKVVDILLCIKMHLIFFTMESGGKSRIKD